VAAEAKFTIGAKASCSDGSCGEVRRLIIDPATDTVTHLVIQPGHRREAGRLVPVHLVDTAAGEVRLRCTLAQFDQLDPAEESEMVAGPLPDNGDFVGGSLEYGTSDTTYAPVGGAAQLIGVGPMPKHPRTIVEDVIPMGETEVGPGDHVLAVDGQIGRVHGFLVNPGDGGVTHVLLQEGRLWGRKEIAIPISAVTRVDPEIQLNLTKEQVGDLPPAT
jgi:sporulation protein YlmC with PRC-barrel domain